MRNKGSKDHFEKSFDIAVVYVGLNEKDETFRWLDIGYKERSLEFRTLRYYPINPDIRKDPRYAAIFELAGLSP